MSHPYKVYAAEYGKPPRVVAQKDDLAFAIVAYAEAETHAENEIVALVLNAGEGGEGQGRVSLSVKWPAVGEGDR